MQVDFALLMIPTAILGMRVRKGAGERGGENSVGINWAALRLACLHRCHHECQ